MKIQKFSPCDTIDQQHFLLHAPLRPVFISGSPPYSDHIRSVYTKMIIVLFIINNLNIITDISFEVRLLEYIITDEHKPKRSI